MEQDELLCSDISINPRAGPLPKLSFLLTVTARSKYKKATFSLI